MGHSRHGAGERNLCCLSPAKEDLECFYVFVPFFRDARRRFLN